VGLRNIVCFSSVVPFRHLLVNKSSSSSSSGLMAKIQEMTQKVFFIFIIFSADVAHGRDYRILFS
jgi:hypothetical protein